MPSAPIRHRRQPSQRTDAKSWPGHGRLPLGSVAGRDEGRAMKTGLVIALAVLAVLVLGSLIASAIAIVMKVVVIAIIVGFLWLLSRRRRANR